MWQIVIDNDQLQIDNNYEIQRILGQGKFGQVFLCSHSTEEGVRNSVIKKIELDPFNKKMRENAEKEIKNLRKLKHNNIIQIKNHKIDHFHLYIVLEYANRGDLSQQIERILFKDTDQLNVNQQNKQIEKNLREHKDKLSQNSSDYTYKRQIYDFFHQICNGVAFIHNEKYIHRDLKCPNILITQDQNCHIWVKLGDFGSVRSQQQLEQTEKLQYTRSYAAPEVFLKRQQSYESDIWALGVIFYKMLTLELPFQDLPEDPFENIPDAFKTSTLIYNHNYLQSYDPKVQEIIESIFQKNPQRRPSAQFLRDKMKFIISDLDTNNYGKGNIQQKADVQVEVQKEIGQHRSSTVERDLWNDPFGLESEQQISNDPGIKNISGREGRRSNVIWEVKEEFKQAEQELLKSGDEEKQQQQSMEFELAQLQQVEKKLRKDNKKSQKVSERILKIINLDEGIPFEESSDEFSEIQLKDEYKSESSKSDSGSPNISPKSQKTGQNTLYQKVEEEDKVQNEKE